MLLKKLWTYSQVIEQFFLHYHFKEHLRIQLYVDKASERLKTLIVIIWHD